ncbi:DUF1348 family protein [Alicyclobacillus acidoterrestris]|uniref:Nuclear transport factor 2 family protein n=1 Tax=Alicyclobacillus acidoterrestris (strain ATCC 49025 / DSM 3922 / CIP 106132 / NCIMB 13137 / GD3B) TaxID=1356854 RepID=T0CIP3_ALIAG|nr:DUF1348 family protein [Alicyclobacillus acidoterrestris]EPZ52664.1 hypothetical protein N007_19970 [Alicyclobacillus acidoterrestris ATCC 49025]UNO48621.1 nuclear transport factor 2 family protein [Alicyclobacillus acidoterrestris]
MQETYRPPIPPFDEVTARQKVRMAENAWNTRDAERVAFEWHDDSGNWFRSYGNENWAFDDFGLMTHRHASINDLPIAEKDRLFRWKLGPRPDRIPELEEFGL